MRELPFLIIQIDKLTVYSSPGILDSSPRVLGFMAQGKRPIFEIQHFFNCHVSTRESSLCGPPRVCVVVIFLREDPVCLIWLIPESSGFHHKSIFTIRRAHLRQSRGIKCMWSLKTIVKHTRTKNHCLLVITHT